MASQDADEDGGDERAAEVDRLIRETRREYEGRDVIALLGTTGAGKTVATALLKHTLSTVWVPRSGGRWEAQMVSGHDEINSVIREMQDGRFPPPTLKGSYPGLEIAIHRMVDTPSKTELVLRDMSGENYRAFTEPGPADADEMLSELLAGSGAYIAHATKYALMIDCEEAKHWDTDNPQAVNTLRKIVAIKKRLGGVDGGGRLTSPIALVFTKADTLPGDLAKKTAAALLDRYHDLKSSLRVSHSGPRKCFKVHVQVAGGAGSTGEEGEAGNGAVEKRLAVPLCYTIREYHRLISWLVDTR